MEKQPLLKQALCLENLLQISFIPCFLIQVYQVLFFILLKLIDRIILRGDIEGIFEEYSLYFKETSSSKIIVNDAINLLFSLNFIEK